MPMTLSAAPAQASGPHMDCPPGIFWIYNMQFKCNLTKTDHSVKPLHRPRLCNLPSNFPLSEKGPKLITSSGPFVTPHTAIFLQSSLFQRMIPLVAKARYLRVIFNTQISPLSYIQSVIHKSNMHIESPIATTEKIKQRGIINRTTEEINGL